MYDEYGQPLFGAKEKIGALNSVTIQSEFIHDNTLWGYTGPINGSRYKLDVEYSPKVAQNNLEYVTVEGDFRKYFRFLKDYNFVTKLSLGGSFGDSPRMFFLGGTDYWLNARVSSISSYIENGQDLFFARFPFPLRGFNYYEVYGRKYFLTNFEFRFPFIRYLALGWPIPLTIGNISGTAFTDIGSAWEKQKLGPDNKITLDKSFHGGGQASNGTLYLDDIKMSWGFGVRMNLGFAVVRFDTAWRTTINKTDSKPMFILSMGPDF
jgi:outer membrane protein assembly factor BamA